MAAIMQHPLWMTWVQSCREAGIVQTPQQLIRSFRRFLRDAERGQQIAA
ncbi:hypothetical protein [Streptomyces sp. NPDC090022]